MSMEEPNDNRTVLAVDRSHSIALIYPSMRNNNTLNCANITWRCFVDTRALNYHINNQHDIYMEKEIIIRLQHNETTSAINKQQSAQVKLINTQLCILNITSCITLNRIESEITLEIRS